MTADRQSRVEERNDPVLVLSGDAVGPALSAKLDRPVVALCTEPGLASRSQTADRILTPADPQQPPREALEVSAAILAHPKASLNLLYATRLVGEGVTNLIVRVDDPDQRAVFETLPVRTVSPTDNYVDRLQRSFAAQVPIEE